MKLPATYHNRELFLFGFIFAISQSAKINSTIISSTIQVLWEALPTCGVSPNVKIKTRENFISEYFSSEKTAIQYTGAVHHILVTD